MDEGRLPSSDSAREQLECRDISDFSRDELLAHINSLQMEISGKDGIIRSLSGDLPVSTDRSTDVPSTCKRRLENTIVEQNLMIESLREELRFRQKELERSNDESFSLRDEARNEIKQLKFNVEQKELRWKEENRSLQTTLEELKYLSGNEKDDLQLKLEKEKKKTHFLEQQLELSSNRLEELHKRESDHEAEMNIIRYYFEGGMNKSNQLQIRESETQNSTSSTCETVKSSIQDQEPISKRSKTGIVDELIGALNSYETENSKLKEMCENHNIVLDKIKDDLSSNFLDDLNHINRALNRHLEIILSLSTTKSFIEHPSVDDCDSTDLFSSSTSRDYVMNILVDKIEKCSIEINKYHEGVVESKRKIVHTENSASTSEGKSVEVLKSQHEVALKNKDDMIVSLKMALDECVVRERNSNEEIKRLIHDLNNVESKFKGLKKNYDQLAMLQDDSGNLLRDLAKKEAKEGMAKGIDGRTTFDGDRLSPISKFGLPSELTPHKLSFSTNFITSTPYPAHLKGAGEGLSLGLSSDECSCQSSIMKWVEKCQKLNSQNSVLKNQVNDLKMVISKLENDTASIYNEMRLIDLQRKDLDSKLSDYAEMKSKCCELTEISTLNQLKITELRQEVERLETLNKKLIEANEDYESKSNERHLHEGPLDVLKDLSIKINEIVYLKGQVYTLACAKRALQQKCHQLSKEKNVFVLKLEQQMIQSNLSHNEIERLLRNNSNLSTCIQCLQNDNQMLKKSLEHLNHQRKLNWGLLENQALADEMFGELLTLCREAIEKKLEFEKLLPGGKCGSQLADEMDARHCVELLMKDNGLLVHEKECLLAKIIELEKTLHDIQKSQGCDDYILHMNSVETSLVKEIRDQREQHARIEEAIRSTGKLHNELQKEKDENKIKVVEFAKLQKKYLDEKLKAQTVETDAKLLKEKLKVESELLKVMENEKQRFENDLKTAKDSLIATEQKLEFEIQYNQIKSRWAEIQNAKNEIVEQFSSATEDSNLLIDEDFEYYKMIRQQIESDYTQALETMKVHLAEEFAQKTLNDHISHRNQLNYFNTIIQQQSESIERLTSLKLIEELTSNKDITPEHKILLENMDKCKTDIEEVMASTVGTEDAARIKKAFLDYFNYQIFFAQKILQDEHRSQYSLAVSIWEQFHETGLKIEQLKFEALKYKDKLEDISGESKNEFQVAEFGGGKNDFNAAHHAVYVLTKSCISYVERSVKTWCTSFKKKMSNLEEDIKKEMSSIGTQIETRMKHTLFTETETLISQENYLVDSAKVVVDGLESFKDDLRASLTRAVGSLFDGTKKLLEDFEKNNDQLVNHLALKDEVVKVKKEKEESEARYSLALQLLQSDHNQEVKKLDTVLMELKNLSEIGCRADAMLRLKDDLEEKHRREVEELRTYFERKVADLEKNFSEEVYSQHSRRMSSSSSCADDDLDHEKVASSASCRCDSGSMAVIERAGPNLFTQEDIKESKGASNVLKRQSKKVRQSDCVSCAAKFITKFILDETRSEVENELMVTTGQEDVGTSDTIRKKSKLSCENIDDWEVEEMERSIVARTISEVGYKFCKSSNDLIGTQVLDNVRNLDNLMSGTLMNIERLVNAESGRLDELSNNVKSIAQDVGRTSSVKSTILPNHNYTELDNLSKDRVNLDKITRALKLASSDLSQYLTESEQKFIKDTQSELARLCSDTGDEKDVDTLEQNDEKHVHFEQNLSTLINELNYTINNESALQDSSTRFREDVHSCLSKLKQEAANLYKLSNDVDSREPNSSIVKSQIEELKMENAALLREMKELRLSTSIDTLESPQRRIVNFSSNMEAVYGDSEESSESFPAIFDCLEKKARKFLQQVKESAVFTGLETIIREGDVTIDELQAKCDDLKQQVAVAEERLRSTRKFLDEQAVERENERDEFCKEKSNLEAALREKDKECAAIKRYSLEVLEPRTQNARALSRKVEELTKELEETGDRLSESLKQEEILQANLRDANQQLQDMKDINSSLKSQLKTKRANELELETTLETLEGELKERDKAQSLMAEEINNLKTQSFEESRDNEQMQELAESIKSNSSTIRQIQHQVKDMGSIIDKQTRELERNHVEMSNNSLSSPSEETSIRELLSHKNPEHSPSPVNLPIEDINKLHEKIVRHARADEVILKKLSDQEIRLTKYSDYAKEMKTERDVLHEQVDKLKSQIAEANNKIDYLRRKADSSSAVANRDIILENQRLKDNLSEIEILLETLKHELQDKESQLENAKETIADQNNKLRSLVQCDEGALNSLRLELAAAIAERNKFEGIVEKYKGDLDKYGNNPIDIDSLLTDKNDEIRLLQDTLTQLQSGSDKLGSRSSKGLRVSFAAENESSSSISLQESKLRDCPQNDSLQFDEPPQFFIQPLKSSTQREFDISAVQHPVGVSLCVSPHTKAADNSEANDKMKLELLEKDQAISNLEKQLAYYKEIEEDLLKTNSQVQETVISIAEDKKYYSDQISSMVSKLQIKVDECNRLQQLLADRKTKISTMSSDIENLRGLVAMTQEKLNEAQGLAVEDNVATKAFQMKISDLELDINKREIENANLTDDIAKVKSENIGLKEIIDRLKEEKTIIERNLAEMEVFKNEEFEKLDDEIQMLTQENDKLRREFESCQNNSEVERLENCIKTMKIDAEDAKRSLESEAILKKKLQQQIERLSSTLKSYELEKEALYKEKNAISKANDEIHQELDNVRGSVKSLRDNLANLKKREGPYISLLESMDSDDVKKLYLEVNKLISDFGQLEFEKNCLQQELTVLKSTRAHPLPDEAQFDKLSEPISRLENLNSEIKDNSNKVTQQLNLEINRLSNEIKRLQNVEQRANDRLTAALTENNNLCFNLSKMEKELSNLIGNRKSFSEKGLQTKSANLSKSTDAFEILGSYEISEGFGGQYRENSPFFQPAVPAELNWDLNSPDLAGRSTDNMKIIREMKEKQWDLESQLRELKTEKLDAELNLKTVEKMIDLQEKKMSRLSAELRKKSGEHLQLELTVQNEKTCRLHAENELNAERLKMQTVQMENLNVLEKMRTKLEIAMANEAKLKAMVVEKHDQCDSAIAKLNNFMVMERYKSESENEGFSKSLKACFAESQEMCKNLKVELDKQKRFNEDLNVVLSRERRSLTSLQEQVKSLETERSKLRADLNSEISRTQILQQQLNEVLSTNEILPPFDYEKMQEMERECARLRGKVSILQDLNDQWRASAYTPVIEQLNELKSNIDGLANEKRELQRIVSSLARERDSLCSQIAGLREELANMRLSSEKMDFPPSVSAKLDIYLGRYFRAESYRKSLVAQKKYLIVVLNGLEKSHQMTLSAMIPNRPRTRQKRKFKGVAQIVIAVARMKFLVRKRKLACESAYISFLRSLGFTSEVALSRADAAASNSMRHPDYSYSPPTKDCDRVRRRNCQPATHSEYLAALQEVQKLTKRN